jgi:hypothetical protein
MAKFVAGLKHIVRRVAAEGHPYIYRQGIKLLKA